MGSTSAGLAGLPAQLGRYELRGVLGRGGMGRVVLAHDPVLRREVAIKLVEPTAVAPEDLAELRFLFHREARATAALRHPNIVQVFDYSGPEAELLYLACELIDGLSLREVLGRGPLTPAVAAACGYELAQALAHAHARGIVHRDVKPENVLWSADGRLVMADFGIAKALGGSLRLGGTVRFGATSVYGSPAYMAPEQLAGRVEPRSDLFALGALLFESLTAQPAFSGQDLDAILEAAASGVHAPWPDDPGVPPALTALVDDLLATDPERRPGSAIVVQERLRALLDALGVGDPRRLLVDFGAAGPAPADPDAPAADPPLRPVAQQPRRRRLLLTAAVLLAIGALAGTAALLLPRAPPPAASARASVICEPAGEQAELWLDGESAGACTPGRELELTAGRHRLERRDARGHAVKEVLVVAGTRPRFVL